MLDIGQQAKEGGQSQHAQSVTQSLLLERICCSSTEQPAKIKHELKPCPGVFRQLFKSYIYIYIYTHTHTHTHTYIYIYVYIYFICNASQVMDLDIMVDDGGMG